MTWSGTEIKNSVDIEEPTRGGKMEMNNKLEKLNGRGVLEEVRRLD